MSKKGKREREIVFYQIFCYTIEPKWMNEHMIPPSSPQTVNSKHCVHTLFSILQRIISHFFFFFPFRFDIVVTMSNNRNAVDVSSFISHPSSIVLLFHQNIFVEHWVLSFYQFFMHIKNYENLFGQLFAQQPNEDDDDHHHHHHRQEKN